MFCGKCGAQIDSAEKICPYCGTSVQIETADENQTTNGTYQNTVSEPVAQPVKASGSKKSRGIIIGAVVAIVVVVVALIVITTSSNPVKKLASAISNMTSSNDVYTLDGTIKISDDGDNLNISFGGNVQTDFKNKTAAVNDVSLSMREDDETFCKINGASAYIDYTNNKHLLLAGIMDYEDEKFSLAISDNTIYMVEDDDGDFYTDEDDLDGYGEYDAIMLVANAIGAVLSGDFADDPTATLDSLVAMAEDADIDDILEVYEDLNLDTINECNKTLVENFLSQDWLKTNLGYSKSGSNTIVFEDFDLEDAYKTLVDIYAPVIDGSELEDLLDDLSSEIEYFGIENIIMEITIQNNIIKTINISCDADDEELEIDITLNINKSDLKSIEADEASVNEIIDTYNDKREISSYSYYY